jgi:hypothetical protein
MGDNPHAKCIIYNFLRETIAMGRCQNGVFSMKIILFARVPRLRASLRNGGARGGYNLVTDPPRGRPFGGGGVHRLGGWKGTNLSSESGYG